MELRLYSEKHRFSVMAVYVIHASLLLIFAGGIIDGVFGFSGFIAAAQGPDRTTSSNCAPAATRRLPFSVKCYSAGQENYADGSPKKWWSKLAVVENGKEVASKEIVVNDPLVYQACASTRPAMDRQQEGRRSSPLGDRWNGRGADRSN